MTVPSRLQTVARKVPTPFGALYAHVSADGSGAVREVAISTLGKHEDTTLGETLIALGAAITDCQPARPADEGPSE